MGTRLCEQILIGTPKEMASLRILGGFDTDQIVLGIFDDADIEMTSDIVQTYLVKPLAAAQIVLTSATINKNYGVHNAIEVFVEKECEILDNLSLYFIQCDDEYHKFKVMAECIDAVFRKFHSDTRVMVFCNVCVLHLKFLQES